MLYQILLTNEVWPVSHHPAACPYVHHVCLSVTANLVQIICCFWHVASGKSTPPYGLCGNM